MSALQTVKNLYILLSKAWNSQPRTAENLKKCEELLAKLKV